MSKIPLKKNITIKPEKASGNFAVLPQGNKASFLKPDFSKSNAPITKVPDVGDSFIEPYSLLEKAVQWAEKANSMVQNLEFGAALGTHVQGSGKISKSIVGQSNKFLGKLGGKASHIDVFLKGVDASRALLDPEYRTKASEGVTRLMDSGLDGRDLFLQAAEYAIERPVSFSGALIREQQDVSKKQDQLEKQITNSVKDTGNKKAAQKTAILERGWRNQDPTMLDGSNKEEMELSAAKKFFNNQ
jgi:hypothetical protein